MSSNGELAWKLANVRRALHDVYGMGDEDQQHSLFRAVEELTDAVEILAKDKRLAAHE